MLRFGRKPEHRHPPGVAGSSQTLNLGAVDGPLQLSGEVSATTTITTGAIKPARLESLKRREILLSGQMLLIEYQAAS